MIHRLPETPDTLWLRILGKQKVQQRAIDEINQLDQNSPYRQNALKLLSDLMVVLDARQNQNNRETELLMSLRTSAIYLEQIEKITQKGLQQGIEQGIEQGREEGTILGAIQTLQQILGDVVSGTEELYSQSIIERKTRLAELQERVRSRLS